MLMQRSVVEMLGQPISRRRPSSWAKVLACRSFSSAESLCVRVSRHCRPSRNMLPHGPPTKSVELRSSSIQVPSRRAEGRSRQMAAYGEVDASPSDSLARPTPPLLPTRAAFRQQHALVMSSFGTRRPRAPAHPGRTAEQGALTLAGGAGPPPPDIRAAALKTRIKQDCVVRGRSPPLGRRPQP